VAFARTSSPFRLLSLSLSVSLSLWLWLSLSPSLASSLLLLFTAFSKVATKKDTSHTNPPLKYTTNNRDKIGEGTANRKQNEATAKDKNGK
jgi:hypothetical protein